MTRQAVAVTFQVDAPTRAEAERLLGMWLPAARSTWRSPGTEPLVSWSVHPTVDSTTYDRLLAAEDALGALGVTTSQVDLVNVIRRVVDDQDDLQDEDDAARVVRAAYEHFVSHGGVDYDTDVGELLYSTVRDAVSDAMRDQGFIS